MSGLRRLNSTFVNQGVTTVKNEITKMTSSNYIHQQFTNLNNWYTRVLGLDEVKRYQDRVVSLQERLLETQEKRREVGRNLAEIRMKSRRYQDEIQKTSRQDNPEHYFKLLREETDVIRLENEITRTFQEWDQKERDIFTAFTNTVRDSHEKQRAQLEYTKYFGLILSITGSFLTFTYSTFKKNDLKKYIEQLANKPSVIDHANYSAMLGEIKSDLQKFLQVQIASKQTDQNEIKRDLEKFIQRILADREASANREQKLPLSDFVIQNTPQLNNSILQEPLFYCAGLGLLISIIIIRMF